MTVSDVSPHPLSSLTATDRMRISWFRSHRLLGRDGGHQIWALEALRAMADDPVAVDVFDFDGTFEHDGTIEATRVITTAGLQPACDWHLSHDGHTWALDSLRPAG